MKHCPNCRSRNVRRSQFHHGERQRHFLQSPYRCNTCAERFWVLSRKVRVRLATVCASLLVATALTVTGAQISRLLARTDSSELAERTEQRMIDKRTVVPSTALTARDSPAIDRSRP